MGRVRARVYTREQLSFHQLAPLLARSLFVLTGLIRRGGGILLLRNAVERDGLINKRIQSAVGSFYFRALHGKRTRLVGADDTSFYTVKERAVLMRVCDLSAFYLYLFFLLNGCYRAGSIQYFIGDKQVAVSARGGSFPLPVSWLAPFYNEATV